MLLSLTNYVNLKMSTFSLESKFISIVINKQTQLTWQVLKRRSLNSQLTFGLHVQIKI